MQLEQKVTPFLSFQSQAGEAAEFYVSLLPGSKVVKSMKNPATGGVITVEFQLAGLNFVALNVGQDWKFSDSFSLAVTCETQQEIDDLWDRLSDGGEELQCGWVRDKFGLAWQIVPQVLPKMLADTDPVRSQRAMGAMMQMVKLDIARLQQAYDGE